MGGKSLLLSDRSPLPVPETAFLILETLGISRPKNCAYNNSTAETLTLYSANMAEKLPGAKLLLKISIHCSYMARYTLSIAMPITCGLQIESLGASAG
jgi:hypothetical protein